MIRARYAVEKALAGAGLGLPDIAAVSASCIGADWAFEYEVGRKNLRAALGVADVRLYNDCVGALRGGTETRGRDCGVLCLGTGANCAVLSRDGRDYIYAYYLKGIHQGAGAIGNFVFQAVFDAESGIGAPTALTGLLLEKTGYASVEELCMSVTTGRAETEAPWRPVYQDYGPLLFQAIRMGDAVAKDYIDWFCAGLARYVTTAARRLDIQDRDFTLVLSGGVPKGGDVMRGLLEQKLKEEMPALRCVNARFEPVVGALLLEYDRLYPEGVPPEVMDELERSAGRYRLFRSLAPV
jgi:N-acetylglucosamine kinase-like BadF-type ATPase